MNSTEITHQASLLNSFLLLKPTWSYQALFSTSSSTANPSFHSAWSACSSGASAAVAECLLMGWERRSQDTKAKGKRARARQRLQSEQWQLSQEGRAGGCCSHRMSLGAGPPGFPWDAKNKCPACGTVGPAPPVQGLRDSPLICPEWLAETHQRQQKSIKSLLTHSLSEPS